MRLSVGYLVCSVLFSFSAASAADEVNGLSDRQLRKLTHRRASSQALASVCKNVSRIGGGQMLIKSELSGHIGNPGDPRQNGYTLICGSQCPRSFPATIFYSDGTQAAKVGYYGTYSANGRPRAYCGVGGAARCNIGTVASIARRKKTGKDLYVQMDGRSKTCKQFSATGRSGGV